jgi:lysine 2,3-aminomutase
MSISGNYSWYAAIIGAYQKEKSMANTPFTSRRAPVYADVPDEKWNNWRWQLSNRINTVAEFEKVIPLTESERKALSAPNLFRVDITPYFISLIDPDDLNDPIRKQVVPTEREMVPFMAMMEDSLAEDRHSPVPGLVHRYPDRVLMLVTTQCASYCRYCTRSRIVGDPSATFSRAEFEMQIEYLKRTPQVRDVLLSGGDSAGAGAENPGGNLEAFARDPAHRDRADRIASAGVLADAGYLRAD